MSIQLNPLANPKNIKIVCEICSYPARFACKECRLSYYCNLEHLALDQESIHSKVCSIIKTLRSPPPAFGFEEQRQLAESERKELLLCLLDRSRTIAQKLLFEKNFTNAIPAALCALSTSIQLYGQDSIDLVPCYLLLGEATVGLKNFSQAEAYLAAAEWALLKSHKKEAYLESQSDKALRSQVLLNFGILYFSQNQLHLALESFAMSVGLAATLHGPDSYLLSGRYFQLGLVFEKLSFQKKAFNCFVHVIYIWLKMEFKTLNDAQVAEFWAIINYLELFFQHEYLNLVFALKSIFSKQQNKKFEKFELNFPKDKLYEWPCDFIKTYLFG